MNKYVIIIVLILILIIIYNNKEHFDVDNEASANLASLYKSGNFIVTNLHITGNITADGSVNFLPKGSIIMWNGSVAPNGWSLCDGTNGTPNLKGRFILGMGHGTNLTNRKLNEIGGKENHKLTIEEMPSHNHQIKLRAACWNNGGCDDRIIPANGDGNGQWSDNKIRGTNQNNVSKTTELINSSGSNQPHNNMPPYYVLAYIMKL
jgi:microcystin-dependent protein